MTAAVDGAEEDATVISCTTASECPPDVCGGGGGRATELGAVVSATAMEEHSLLWTAGAAAVITHGASE